MKTKSIRQTVTFASTPGEVYRLIMDQKEHAAFTGSDVVMSKKINGKLTLIDGYCHGYDIELVEGKKIVQAWHFAEDGWPDDHYSTCTFLFEQMGDSTKLTFLQTGVPEHKVESLKGGWKCFYWKPMEAWLKSN
ncbi:MAG: SRPBCC family protein [Ginsengibacter sp.]